MLHGEPLVELQRKAIDDNNKKAKLRLFEYALIYRDQKRLNLLSKSGFGPARNPDRGLKLLNRNHFVPYELKHTGGVTRLTDQYGVDFRNMFNQTPLMIASRLGNETLIRLLTEQGANTELVNSAGDQFLAGPRFAG